MTGRLFMYFAKYEIKKQLDNNNIIGKKNYCLWEEFVLVEDI